jgi:uncharacterized protein
MSAAAVFDPHPLVRNPHVQSLLGSAKVRLIHHRRSGGLGMLRTARERILECGEGTRLSALCSPPRGGDPHAADLAVLIHGWEGCADSTYLLASAELLHREGYAVARLNLRDHGGTHHLNEDLFHANRIDEVVGAVRALGRALPHRRLALIGFSLGGNFALRVGLRAPLTGLRLAQVIAVNPALDPPSTMAAIDRYPLYRGYFLRRWKRSLLSKQRLFPRRYDFGGLDRLGTVRAVSEFMIPRYTPFGTLAEYFEGYTLRDRALASLEVPTTIITAADDPIVSVDHFRSVRRTAAVSVEIQPRGGHCGYIQGPALRSWLESRILAALAP